MYLTGNVKIKMLISDFRSTRRFLQGIVLNMVETGYLFVLLMVSSSLIPYTWVTCFSLEKAFVNIISFDSGKGSFRGINYFFSRNADMVEGSSKC